MNLAKSRTTHFGLLASYSDVEAVKNAAEKVRDAGFTHTDAYSPFPIEGMDEALGIRRSILPKLVLGGGILGFILGYGLQYFNSVIDYPINIGGRPLNSIPAFIPISYECTILLASFTAGIGMLLLNGLPRPSHPIFNVDAFKTASNDGFFLAIESSDPKYETEAVRNLLMQTGANQVYEVPHDDE